MQALHATPGAASQNASPRERLNAPPTAPRLLHTPSKLSPASGLGRPSGLGTYHRPKTVRSSLAYPVSSPASPSYYEERSSAEMVAPTTGAGTTVLRFIEALNQRDLSGMLQLIADDCHHEDLSHEAQARNKEEVARFYSEVVSSMPERLRVVVDDITSGDPLRAGLVWHMEVDGTEVPCSRGLAFYRVAPRPRPEGHTAASTPREGSPPAPSPYAPSPYVITYVRQSPEHFLKLANLALSATASATPLIDSLGPLALPGFWSNLARGASHVLASAPPVDELLINIAAAGASANASGQGNANSNNSNDLLGGGLLGLLGLAGSPAGGPSASAPSAPHPGVGRAFSTVAPPAAGMAGVPSRASPVAYAAAVLEAPARAAQQQQLQHAARQQAAAAAAASAEAEERALRAAAAAAVAAAADAQALLTSASAASAGPSPVAAADAPAAADATVTAAVSAVSFDAPSSSVSADTTAAAPSAAVSASVSVADAEAPQVVATVVSPPTSSSASAAPTAAAPVVGVTAEELAPVGSPAEAEAAVASLAGIWEKDLDRSDVAGYEAALDLWQISGVQKATARLIEGLELGAVPAGRQGGGWLGGGSGGPAFNLHFLTVIPYFKVTETYPLDGKTGKMRRRDQRSGDARASATAVAGGVVCRAAWDAPFAGSLEESYTHPPGQPDVLNVRSTIRVGAKEATTLQVYHRRRGMSARDLISASEQRNGRAPDILRRFGMQAP